MTINLFCELRLCAAAVTALIRLFNRSFTATTVGFIYLFSPNKKRNSNKSLNCCSICVSSTVFLPYLAECVEIRFLLLSPLHLISYSKKLERNEEEEKSHNEQRNNIRNKNKNCWSSCVSLHIWADVYKIIRDVLYFSAIFQLG